MYLRLFFSTLALLPVATLASADSEEYQVQVDTSSISGTAGSLDFQFNPGPLVAQSASLQILDFYSTGILDGGPILTGDVSGLLPGALSFDNGSGFNDYFEGFKFGSSLSLDVKLFGPALTSPDNVSTSGSSFAFSMFQDTAGTIPVLTSDTTDGFAVTANVNLDGSTTIANFSNETSVLPTVNAVPETNSLDTSLMFACLVFLCASVRRRVRVRADDGQRHPARVSTDPGSLLKH
jgi:hypothetical protein